MSTPEVIELHRRDVTLDGAPPPHSLEAETAVLGAVLLSDSVLTAVMLDGTEPSHFYRERHRLLFDAMVAMHQAGTPIDLLTLTEEMRSRGQLDAVGGAAAIDQLAAAVPVVANVRHYAEIVRTTAARRALLDASHHLHAGAHGHRSPHEVAVDVADRLAAPSLGGARSQAVTAAEFLARDRPVAIPLVRSRGHGRPADLLTVGSSILFAGPSGYGKTLAMMDLAGLLASDDGGEWLGADVTGGQRVVLALLEGTEDDIAGRVRELIPASALERVVILDRWSQPLPASAEALSHLARAVARHQADVLFVDTGSALLAGWEDTKYGLTEDHFRHFDGIRFRARAPHLTLGLSTHTRKADRTGAKVDEAEEIAGTFGRKVDAAIVIRPDGEDSPRRRITFAKVRTGPRPRPLIATLPDADSNAAPRLTVIAEAIPKVKHGTEAEQIAAWIGEQRDGPQGVSVITAALGISEDTLRRRRDELDRLGVRYGPIPGRGRAHGYGTVEQWKAAHGFAPGLAAEAPATPHNATPHVRGTPSAGSGSPETHGESPRNPATPHDSPAGYESPESTGDLANPATPRPYGTSTDGAGLAPDDESTQDVA